MLRALELDADKQAFVDAVMEPLGGDAARRDLLEECLAVAETYPGVSQGDPVEFGTRRMQATAGSFKRRYWFGVVVPALLVVVAAWFCVFGPPAGKSLDQVLLANRILGSMSDMCCSENYVPSFAGIGRSSGEFEEAPAIRRAIQRMDPDARLLVFGDLEERDKVARWKAVWDRHPDDPSHFMAYAYQYREANKAWPENFEETGEKLDPGNGWFRFLAAGAKIEASLGVPPAPAPSAAKPLRGSGKPAPPPLKPLRPVKDPAAFAEGVAMLESALAMARWDDHVPSLNRIRFDAMPAAESFGDHALGLVAAALQPENGSSGWESLNPWRDAFAITAAQAAKDSNPGGLEELAGTLQRLELRLAGMPATLVPRLLSRNLQLNACRGLQKAWTDLGDSGKAKRFEAAADSLDPKLHPRPSFPPDALDGNRGSGFTSKFYRGSRDRHSTPVTEPELRGGRMAEYAIYERLIVHVGATFLFFVAVFLGVGMFRDRKLLGLLPARLVGLLRPSDHALTLAVGFVLPLAVYLISTRSGLLAPRDTSLGEARFILWLMQVLSLGIAAILLSIYTMRRCLGRRGAMLAMEAGGLDPGLWMALLALGMMPVAAALPKLMTSSGFVTMLCWTCAGFMGGMPLLWLLNLAIYQFAGSPARRLHRAVLLRSGVWPVALLMVLAAGAIPLLKKEESYWLARLGYDALTPENNIFNTRTDRQYAEGVNAETIKALESLR